MQTWCSYLLLSRNTRKINIQGKQSNELEGVWVSGHAVENDSQSWQLPFWKVTEVTSKDGNTPHICSYLLLFFPSFTSLFSFYFSTQSHPGSRVCPSSTNHQPPGLCPTAGVYLEWKFLLQTQTDSSKSVPTLKFLILLAHTCTDKAHVNKSHLGRYIHPSPTSQVSPWEKPEEFGNGFADKETTRELMNSLRSHYKSRKQPL